MGIKKFIEKVTKSLGLDEIKKSGKKKALKALISKLDTREKNLSKTFKKRSDNKEAKALKEELKIVKVQKKKAEELLVKLTSQKS